jgi:tRNA pseudouridine38-40 synthase
MVRNVFLEIEYIGTNYFGFQIQNKKDKREVTVQEAVEEALEKLFREKVKVTYASRTDRGVHANGQVINFKIDTSLSPKNIKNALNFFLPSDIRIKKIKYVPLDFHSRFSARSKVYVYLILNRREPSVFWRDFAWHKGSSLDVNSMEKVSKKLIGKRDFSIFAKGAKKYASCIREVKNISIKKRGVFLYIYIEANGFLRNMARNIASFLVSIGEGKINLNQCDKILRGKLPYTNRPLPPRGLYLLKVNY